MPLFAKWLKQGGEGRHFLYLSSEKEAGEDMLLKKGNRSGAYGIM